MRPVLIWATWREDLTSDRTIPARKLWSMWRFQRAIKQVRTTSSAMVCMITGEAEIAGVCMYVYMHVYTASD